MSDGWGGPTWAQWYDEAKDADAASRTAKSNYEAANQWKAYAERLERELDEVWNLYRDARGNAGGQRRLKNLAMEELTRIDPSNRILDPAFREREFDAAKADAMKETQRQR